MSNVVLSLLLLILSFNFWKLKLWELRQWESTKILCWNDSAKNHIYLITPCRLFYILLENIGHICRRCHCLRRTPEFKPIYIHIYAQHRAVTVPHLACHTYCDMGHPFIMVIFEDPWHSHLLQSVGQLNCHYLFLRLRSVAAAIWTPNLPLAGRTL